jgi:hypothetical protein
MFYFNFIQNLTLKIMEYTIKELLEIPEETQNIEFKRLV